MTEQAAAWLPDPSARYEMRYWDGSTWTEHVSRAGVQSADPDGVAVAVAAEQAAPAPPAVPAPAAAPTAAHAPPPFGAAPMPAGTVSTPVGTKKSGGKGCLIAFLVVAGIAIVIGIIAVVGIMFAANKTVSNVQHAANAGKDDVTITSCETSPAGPVVEVEINNHSSKSSNYIISVSLVDSSGTEVSTVGGAAQGVPPSVKRRVPLSGSSAAEFTKCKIGTVTRFATTNGA